MSKGIGFSFDLNLDYIKTIEDPNIFEKRLEKELKEQFAVKKIGSYNIYEFQTNTDYYFGIMQWFIDRFSEFPQNIFTMIKFYEFDILDN